MNIHRPLLRAASVLALAALLVAGLSAQAKKESSASSFQGEFKTLIGQVQGQIMDLEAAIPQEKMNWRPAEGVRSISEVYLHLSWANYFVVKLAGYAPPADADFYMDTKKWEGQTSDKAKIASIMKRSFEHVIATGSSVSNADLEKKVNVFGTEMSVRAAFMVTLSHLHEHLGQSIAYARMNGVVPPWTADQQKKEAEQMKMKK